MRLRRQITRMMNPVDILKFSQFTIDWLQELDDADNHGDTTGDEQTDNLALAYEIDTIREVLRYGQDKDLFDMLATYARFYLPAIEAERAKERAERGRDKKAVDSRRRARVT